jgi:hypothetical protein
MYGGVAGEAGRPVPYADFTIVAVTSPGESCAGVQLESATDGIHRPS